MFKLLSIQSNNAHDFGFWLEQLQQHRLYQQNKQEDPTEAASIIQLSGKVTSSDNSQFPSTPRGYVSSTPYSPSVTSNVKSEGKLIEIQMYGKILLPTNWFLT